MTEITSQQMAGKLLASGFERSGPSATTLSDPIADTPMVVTLDQLRPYDHDPRMKRNPAYEEIKASIRERGLDAAPAITRRPGEDHYIIRNGGNTRLAILRELPVFRAIPYVLVLDGVRHETEAMLVAVGNGPAYGGGMRVVPGAEFDDGLLDVLVLSKIAIPEIRERLTDAIENELAITESKANS